MGEIDDADHAEDQRKADADESIDAAKKKPDHQDGKEVPHPSVSRK
ncbi:MAG: hypothetical protein M0Z28_26690 [Rhodospirillales bacterium]|nr:hypothetical protein [Rhodospirillales bacterium]